jgi:hypothetical protein
MNKKAGLILGIIILFSFLIGFIGAAWQDTVSSGIDSFIDLVRPYLGALLNETDTTHTSTMFMAKLLFSIILICAIYLALEKGMTAFFSDKQWAIWIIAVAVTLLGIRFLRSDWIYAMILPQATLAVALTSIIPFIIFFFVVRDWTSPTLRRIGWIFFGAVFFALYLTNSDKLSAAGSKAYLIYPITAIVSLLMILFDGTIQKFRAKIEIEKADSSRKSSTARVYRLQLAEIKTIFDSNSEAYVGQYAGGGKGKPHGLKAYEADVEYLNDKIVKLS